MTCLDLQLADLFDDLCLCDLCDLFFLHEVEELEELEELEEQELVDVVGLLDDDLEDEDFIVLHLDAHFGSELDELKKLFKCPRDISVMELVLTMSVNLYLDIVIIILIIYKKILSVEIKIIFINKYYFPYIKIILNNVLYSLF